MQLKQGDIIVNAIGERKILAVNGDVVFIEKSNGEVDVWTLKKVIVNGYTLKPQAWKPAYDETYYAPAIDYSIRYCSAEWTDDSTDHHRLAHNLVFKDKESAIKRAEEILKMIK